jgi:hypothetical protein
MAHNLIIHARRAVTRRYHRLKNLVVDYVVVSPCL